MAENKGYILVMRPDHPRAWSTGYVYEHILVVEESLGRYLREGEVVHHKDGNRKNNSPENLKVVLKSDHPMEHCRMRGGPPMVKLVCAYCGITFPRQRNHRPEVTGTKITFCSRECKWAFQRTKQGWVGNSVDREAVS